MVYCMIYTIVYIMVYTMIYTVIYHGIYSDILYIAQGNIEVIFWKKVMELKKSCCISCLSSRLSETSLETSSWQGSSSLCLCCTRMRMVNTFWLVTPTALLHSKWHMNLLVQERFPSPSCCTWTGLSSSWAFLSNQYIVSYIA
jgi:hypothetical protein